MSELYNEDELTPPAWLNADFFIKVLKHIEPNAPSIQLNNFHIEPASKRGDHYASLMFRATIDYNSNNNHHQHLSVIIKTLPSADTAKGHNLQGSHFMSNEIHIYRTVIPRFEAMWQQYGVSVKFAGRLLYASHHPYGVMVLEDLCTVGYDILRQRLFEHNEVKACLGKLAQWHAVSLKLSTEKQYKNNNNNNNNDDDDEVKEYETIVTQLQHGLFTATNLMNSAYMQNGMRNMIAALEHAGGFEVYLPKLRAMQPQLLQRCRDMNDAYARDAERSMERRSIYVLNHGDFHTKNLMVRWRQNGELDDLLFIDFQASFLGPSCADLQYLSITLFDRKLRDEKREELFQFYFSCFQESLRTLQFQGPMPTYKDFKQDCKQWRHFEIYLLATNLPLTVINPEQPPQVDINRIFDSEEYRLKYYHNADYINYLRDLLPQYMAAGYLD